MINLSKGESVSIKKAPTMSVVMRWPAATDYDLGAEILYKDGSTESIAMFPAVGTPSRRVSKGGAVTHGGDAGRGAGTASESLSIVWDDQIAAIAPWAYSAQSNGAGSFRKYGVSLTVTAGDEVVHIDANKGSRNPVVYTCVPGIIRSDGDDVTVEYEEHYSGFGSESRPRWNGDYLTMDGPRNQYK